jgi:hypothetical protein
MPKTLRTTRTTKKGTGEAGGDDDANNGADNDDN